MTGDVDVLRDSTRSAYAMSAALHAKAETEQRPNAKELLLDAARQVEHEGDLMVGRPGKPHA